MDNIQIRARCGANHHLGMGHVAVVWPGVSLLQEEAWRTEGKCWWEQLLAQCWSCLVWRREGLGGCPQCTEIPEGQEGKSQVFLRGAQWEEQGQWPQGETWELSPEHQETLMWGRLSRGTGCPQRWWSPHPWGHSEVIWGCSWTTSPCWACFKQRGRTTQCPDVPLDLKLWSCDPKGYCQQWEWVRRASVSTQSSVLVLMSRSSAPAVPL